MLQDAIIRCYVFQLIITGLDHGEILTLLKHFADKLVSLHLRSRLPAKFCVFLPFSGIFGAGTFLSSGCFCRPLRLETSCYQVAAFRLPSCSRKLVKELQVLLSAGVNLEN